MTTPTFSCSWASMVGVQAPNVSSRLSAGPRATISSSRPFAHGPDRRTRTASVSTRRSRTYRTLFSVRSTARSPSASIAHHRVTRRFCFTEERFPRLERVRDAERHGGTTTRRLRLAGVTLGIAGCDSPADKKSGAMSSCCLPETFRETAPLPRRSSWRTTPPSRWRARRTAQPGEAPCSSRAQARSRSRYRTRGNARERWDSVRRSVIRARAITSERRRRRDGAGSDGRRRRSGRETSDVGLRRRGRRETGR